MPRQNKGPHLSFRRERGTYEIIIYERGRRKRLKNTFTGSPEEANAILSSFLIEYYADDSRQKWPKEPEERLITDCLIRYIDDYADKIVNKESLKLCIDHLAGYWSGKLISEICEAETIKYEKHRNREWHMMQRQMQRKIIKDLSSETISRELSVLSSAITKDFQDGKLTRNVYVHLPDKAEPREIWLTRTETANLLRAAKKKPGIQTHTVLYMFIGIYTGARKEQILSLRWPMVDLENERINFKIPGRQLTIKRRPIVPIAPPLMTFLRYARRYASETDYVIRYNNKPINDIKKSFKKAVTKCGLKKDVTPHTLRHTAATWLANNDVHVKRLSRFIGHSNTKTTEKYIHHSPSYLSYVKNSFRKRKEINE